MILRNGAKFDIILRCTGDPLENHAKGKDRIYDLKDTKDRVLKDNHDTSFKIYCYASKEEHTELFQILTHNEYIYDENLHTVQMKDLSGIKSVARYSIGDKVIKTISLSEGINDIGYDYSEGVKLSILEYNYKTHEYDSLRYHKNLGNEIFCTVEGGKLFIVNVKENKKLEIMINITNATKNDFETDLHTR